MSVERVSRSLPASVDELFAPLIHARPRDGGWRLASLDVEQGLCVRVAKGDQWLLVELERRDDARPCYARTARFNVCARLQLAPDQPLDTEQRRVVDQLVELVRRREGQLPVVARPPTTRASEVREIEVAQALVPHGPSHYYLNPYAGCMIGCEFCYVADRADLSRELEGRASLPWGRYVDVKVNAPALVREEVRRLRPGVVKISPILTDPYQPIERRYRITRGCLEAMVDTGFVPAVLTRAARIHDDLALLSRFRRAVVGISIPTDDDAVRRAFEPGGDPIEERVEALAAFARAGVATMAFIQPILPMNADRLVELLAPIARIVRIDRMHDVARVRHLYRAAGREDAAEDAFFDETAARLRSGLVARGVAVDPLEDLEFLVA